LITLSCKGSGWNTSSFTWYYKGILMISNVAIW
jgi:hypothetical protein